MTSAALPSPAGPAGPAPSMWRTTPGGLTALVTGLWIFGTGDAFLVSSGLGNSPWTVFAQGVATRTPMTIGVASILIGAALLLLWVPLGVRVGLGTLLNVVLIGVAIDVTLLALHPPEGLVGQAVFLLVGIALIGLGSGLYLGVALGPGPRDGLMTGLHRRTGRPIGLVRTGIELTALAAGIALGGTAGVGTVAFAVLIGPSVQTGIALDDRRRGLSVRSG